MSTLDYYRRSTLGKCLTDALDELVSTEAIAPELAVRVVEQFDKVRLQHVCQRLSERSCTHCTVCFKPPACFDTILATKNSDNIRMHVPACL